MHTTLYKYRLKIFKTILNNIKSEFSNLKKEIISIKNLIAHYIETEEQWLNPKERKNTFDNYYKFLTGFQKDIEPKQSVIKEKIENLKDYSVALDSTAKEIDLKVKELVS